MLTLALEKPGQNTPKLKLALDKDGGIFTVEIAWDCNPAHEDDLDAHALAAYNAGNGAKVTSLEQVLSTYNTKLMNPGQGVLLTNPDSSFGLFGGAVSHSGDKRIQKNKERITINTSKLGSSGTQVNEIPLFATVHEADHGEGHGGGHEDEEEAAFADIELVTVTIKDGAGKILGEYKLSDEFGEFNVVQLGSIMLSNSGIWEYEPVGRGFTGDFNDILAYFS